MLSNPCADPPALCLPLNRDAIGSTLHVIFILTFALLISPLISEGYVGVRHERHFYYDLRRYTEMGLARRTTDKYLNYEKLHVKTLDMEEVSLLKVYYVLRMPEQSLFARSQIAAKMFGIRCSKVV